MSENVMTDSTEASELLGATGRIGASVQRGTTRGTNRTNRTGVREIGRPIVKRLPHKKTQEAVVVVHLMALRRPRKAAYLIALDPCPTLLLGSLQTRQADALLEVQVMRILVTPGNGRYPTATAIIKSTPAPKRSRLEERV